MHKWYADECCKIIFSISYILCKPSIFWTFIEILVINSFLKSNDSQAWLKYILQKEIYVKNADHFYAAYVQLCLFAIALKSQPNQLRQK